MFFTEFISNPSLAIAVVIAIVIGVTVHEFCHAWMATYLGDPTARYQGRLSLNPLAHLDPLGTIALLLAGFGWGKPVPFSLAHLRNPKVDAALIALAGPLSNLFLALIFAIPYRYLVLHAGSIEETHAILLFLFTVIQMTIHINLILMIFNLLPLPPLDGSKILTLLLPGDYIGRLYQYRNMSYVLLLILVFSPSLFGVNILGDYIFEPLLKFFWSLALYAT